MPGLPWTSSERFDVGPETVVLGSRLELRSFRHVPSFLWSALQIRRQVRNSPGAIGVALIAQPLSKTFWTVSAWTDQASLDTFVGTLPHVAVMPRFHDRLSGSLFRTWRPEGFVRPPKGDAVEALWADVRQRLDA